MQCICPWVFQQTFAVSCKLLDYFLNMPNISEHLLEGIVFIINGYELLIIFQQGTCGRNIQHFFQWKQQNIWSSDKTRNVLIEKRSDCNWTRTQNHLVLKRTLNHLAKLAKWLSCVLSTYLYGAFDCMFLSCHVRVWEWIHTL